MLHVNAIPLQLKNGYILSITLHDQKLFGGLHPTMLGCFNPNLGQQIQMLG